MSPAHVAHVRQHVPPRRFAIDHVFGISSRSFADLHLQQRVIPTSTSHGPSRREQQLAAITNRIGLEKYGTEGEPFDPQIHEALLHDTSADVAVATASKILQPGYKYKERILRPARVAVTDPEN